MTEMLRDNRDLERFEGWIDGEFAGEISYLLHPSGVIELTHTELREAARGTGLAGRLATFAFEQIRAEGTLKAKPSCPYLIAWTAKHPEYADLLAASE